MWSKASLKREPHQPSKIKRLIRRAVPRLLLFRGGLDKIILECQQNAHRPLKRYYRKSKLFIKNKKLAKGLLIDLLFLKLEISNHKRKTSSVVKKFLLKNKNLFTDSTSYTKSYLTSNDKFNSIDKFAYISDRLNIQSRIIPIYRKIKKVVKKLNMIFRRYVYEVLGKLHIYLSRLLFMIAMHFIVFVQLTVQLVWLTQPGTVYAHPLWALMLRAFPFILPVLQYTAQLVTDGEFSFLMLGFYFQIFIIRFKRYKLPRKIAYQAGLSFLLMLVGFTGASCRDIVKVFYKMLNFDFLGNLVGNPDAFLILKNELEFYLQNLEALRREKEAHIVVYENVLESMRSDKLGVWFDVFTLPQLLGIIILFYNCVYFIIKGRRPFIPIVTKAVRRIMIDRNSPESL